MCVANLFTLHICSYCSCPICLLEMSSQTRFLGLAQIMLG